MTYIKVRKNAVRFNDLQPLERIRVKKEAGWDSKYLTFSPDVLQTLPGSALCCVVKMLCLKGFFGWAGCLLCEESRALENEDYYNWSSGSSGSPPRINQTQVEHIWEKKFQKAPQSTKLKFAMCWQLFA